jgi:hypothetical protein
VALPMHFGRAADFDLAIIGNQIMFFARIEGVPLSKAYKLYVVEGGRLITQSKYFIWKPIHLFEIS